MPMEGRGKSVMENPLMFSDSSESGSPVPANGRWNPTKEQINMLESLYRQGIRTPNADQIQQITNRLRAFGHIEGKNVFYWFQNHKARQRQKQKQESIALFHRFLHNDAPPHHHHHYYLRHHQPVAGFSPPSPCTNGVCNPYYLPPSNIGYYQQYSKMILPTAGFKRAARSDKQESCQYIPSVDVPAALHSDPETLPLFPLHPTGILQEKEKAVVSQVSSRLDSCSPDGVIGIYDEAGSKKIYGLSHAEDLDAINL